MDPQTLPEVTRATAADRAVQAEIRSFAGQVKAAMTRVLATPLIAAVCVGLFALMVASGVPAFDPDPRAMFAWGANLGPAVILDGQLWRLLAGTSSTSGCCTWPSICGACCLPGRWWSGSSAASASRRCTCWRASAARSPASGPNR